MHNEVGVNRDHGTPMEDRRQLVLSGKHNEYISPEEKEVIARERSEGVGGQTRDVWASNISINGESFVERKKMVWVNAL